MDVSGAVGRSPRRGTTRRYHRHADNPASLPAARETPKIRGPGPQRLDERTVTSSNLVYRYVRSPSSVLATSVTA